ncbi:unnamed protein product [Lepeophtheirus salmonis]|uniref:(salmon louse) hypothetical protein n=1 Tax=Lepeophtheirus salmonis TaxID=72036 RepID=A0A7R8D5Q1_LEPSM|nr:unnamed protein product [Lepeophtheirus salmonis]CAF3033858.1 unnamed protein product [Lepeophtheirus salmonis]
MDDVSRLLPGVDAVLQALTFVVLSVPAILSERVIQQQDPCQAKNLIVSDVDYCDRYWECLDGQAELYDCPNGLVWVGRNRGIADGCDYPWRNPSLCRDKDLANPPISTEHCDWLYGIFGHETSCTRYWTCWNGTATEQFCVGGLLYNEETHACDWPQNVPYAKMTPTVMCHLESLATATGLAKEAILVFKDALPSTTPASVPHIGKEAVAKAKHLKRTGVRRRNNNNNNNGGGGIEERKSSIPIQDNDALSNSLSGAEPAFSIPQGATLIGGSGGGGFSE